MAWTTSYVVSSTLVAGLTGGAAVSMAASYANLKIALFDNTVTPNADTDPQSYAVAPWNAGECTGTNWPAGGVALSLSGAGLTHLTGGFMKFQAANVSVASTTISTAAFGSLIYDSSLTPKLAICAVWFGGSGYTTSATPFGITWPTGGIWTLDCVP